MSQKPQKNLAQSLNDFVNILTEQELEPIRLDLIRVENDFKESIAQIEKTVGNGLKETTVEIQNDFKKALDGIKEKTETELNEAVTEIQGKLEELSAALKEEREHPPSVDDEKYLILKDAIENLAVKVSEALAEGLSGQEEQYTEICGKLDGKISDLEKNLTQSNTNVSEELKGKISEIEKKFEETVTGKFEELNVRVSKIEQKFKNLAELTNE